MAFINEDVLCWHRMEQFGMEKTGKSPFVCWHCTEKNAKALESDQMSASVGRLANGFDYFQSYLQDRVCIVWRCLRAEGLAMRVQDCWAGSAQSPILLIDRQGCTREGSMVFTLAIILN